MAQAVVDLKMIVQQDRSLVLEVLELGNTLIFDVKAEHRWTKHALESYGQLSRIFGNLVKLLELTEDDWAKGAELFASPEGGKLWATAVALWRALPPIRAKYVEILARRRRQRIMGTELEEVEELDPAVVKQELDQIAEYSNTLRETLTGLQAWIDKLPDGLAPKLTEGEEEQMADAQHAAEDQEPAGEAADDGAAAAPPGETTGESAPAVEAEAATGDAPAEPPAPEAKPAQSYEALESDDFSPI